MCFPYHHCNQIRSAAGLLEVFTPLYIVTTLMSSCLILQFVGDLLASVQYVNTAFINILDFRDLNFISL